MLKSAGVRPKVITVRTLENKALSRIYRKDLTLSKEHQSLNKMQKTEKLFSEFFNVRAYVIENIHFENMISKINFSSTTFRNCIFGSNFTFDHCDLGKVTFESCFFKNPVSFNNCSRKDNIIIRGY